MTLPDALEQARTILIERFKLARDFDTTDHVKRRDAELVDALIAAVRAQVGYHGDQAAQEPASSAQSEAQEKQSLNLAPPASSPETPE